MIIDDFYKDPEEFREWALQQEFLDEGNYPGIRTRGMQQNEHWADYIEEITGIDICRNSWHNMSQNGAIQCIGAGATTWIHADISNEWSGVVYLNPDPPPMSGTSFYRHRKTGSVKYGDSNFGLEDSRILNHNGEGKDPHLNNWEVTDVVENKFNRLILFRAGLWHCQTNFTFFGNDVNDSRLTQTFFFNSTSWDGPNILEGYE